MSVPLLVLKVLSELFSLIIGSFFLFSNEFKTIYSHSFLPMDLTSLSFPSVHLLLTSKTVFVILHWHCIAAYKKANYCAVCLDNPFLLVMRFLQSAAKLCFWPIHPECGCSEIHIFYDFIEVLFNYEHPPLSQKCLTRQKNASSAFISSS